MNLSQPEFALDLVTCGAPTPRALPPSAPHLVVYEVGFGVAVELRALQHACLELHQPEAYFEALEDLRQLAVYKVRRAAKRGTAYVPMTLRLDIERNAQLDGALREVLILPRARAASMCAVLRKLGVEPQLRPADEPVAVLGDLADPFADGSKLEDLQQKTLAPVLYAKRSRIIEYPMGGGKGMLIAATLRAFRHLRPAIVTGSCVTDTAQLAQVLARTLGERVCLLGCAGGVDAHTRRTLLEKDPEKASIVVGTHAVLRNVPPVQLRYSPVSTGTLVTELGDETVEAAGPKRGPNILLGARVARAPLLIADEVDALPTVDVVEHLLGTEPVLFFGFTGTWGRRSDRMDAVLGELVSSGGAQDIVRVNHQAIVATGRVVPVALHVYQFSERDYPYRSLQVGRYLASLNQSLVVQHDGRNRFAGELASYVMDLAERDGGTAIAFTKTIQHSVHVLRHLCALRGLPYSFEALRKLGIVLHNAELPGLQRIANVQAIKAGEARLVVSTDTLAVGFDSKFITDILDLTGMQEGRMTLQRSGRPVRQGEGKRLARFHFVEDTHHPALLKIGVRKRQALEQYFGRAAMSHPAHRLPWHAAQELSDDAIAAELAR